MGYLGEALTPRHEAPMALGVAGEPERTTSNQQPNHHQGIKQ